MTGLDSTDLDTIVRVIQSSLAPAFLLTAIASLLSVFTTRLARISDHVKALGDHPGDGGLTTRRLRVLRRRSSLLDAAVILGALAGACVSSSVLVLFLGLLRAKATALPLFVFFGIAVLCTIGALTAFLLEVLLASRHIRAEVDRNVQKEEAQS